MNKLAVGLLLGLAAASLTRHAFAADPSSGAFATTTLSLTAQGEVRARPDMATLTLGVETTRTTAGSAMRDNAAQMTRVIEALKAQGLAEKDLQTSNLSLSPQYVYEPNQPSRCPAIRPLTRSRPPCAT